MSSPVVLVRDLTIGLPRGADRAHAVQDAGIEIDAGQILCLVGESGSGKSMLASALIGSLPPGVRHLRGSVTVSGHSMLELPERRLRQIRGNRVALISQEPMSALNPAIPVGKQIEEVFAIHTPRIGRQERTSRMLSLLEEMRLPNATDIACRFPHQLSGGQCQRVAIAMALALEPAVLIADEPTTALDVTTQAEILKLLNELRQRHNQAILFITHDFGVVADIADKVAVMQHGRVVETGSRIDLLEHPQHAYTRQLLAAVPTMTPSRPLRSIGTPVLRLRNLTKIYRADQRAVDDVSIQVADGRTLAIVGESGSGKSTLAKMAVRIIEPTAGTVFVDDINLSSLRGRGLRTSRRLVQLIPQDPHSALNPRTTVERMLIRAGMLGGLGRAAAKAQAARLISLVGLEPDALSRRPHAFSGGQRQRLCIARALAIRPKALIADESVSALDVSVQEKILDLLEAVQRDRNLAIIFITHDLRVAARMADDIAVMQNGRIVECAPARDVLLKPVHPYTAKLIAAAPGAAGHHDPLRISSDQRNGEVRKLSLIRSANDSDYAATSVFGSTQ